MRRFQRFSRISCLSGFLSLAFGFIFVSSGFFSCKVLYNSFNEPVKEYFKEYTESAAVMRYEITDGEWNLDEEGRISLSSAKDAEITLYLRNPQRFYFSEANTELDFSELDNSEVEKTLGTEAQESLVTISQDPDDYTVLTLKYPAEFLSQTETGFEISPEISLSHPVSQIPFGTYSDLKLYSNSAPPPVFGAAVYKDSDRYVLFFNMPEKSLLKGIHKDISSISVESSRGSSAESAVEISSDGSFSFGGSSFKTGDDSSGYAPSSPSVIFSDQNGQAAYFVTDDTLSDQNITYTITLKDKAGLYSSVAASANSMKLGEVSVLDSSENTISQDSSGIYNLEQEPESSYATVIFRPAQTASDGERTEDTSDSRIVYEIYQGSDADGKLLASGTNSGGDFTFDFPAGEVFARVYARKDLFADSPVKECRFVVARTTVYVSPDGDDDLNNGSKDSPFRTIAHAISSFSHLEKNGTIYLEGSLSESVTLSVQNANLAIHGNGHSISSLTMSADGGTLTAERLSVSGRVDMKNGTLSLDGGTSGNIEVTGGSLALEYLTVNGNVAAFQNGVISATNMTMTGELLIADRTSSVQDAVAVSVENIEGSKVNVSDAGVQVSGKSVGNVYVQSLNLTLEDLTVNGTARVFGNGSLTLENTQANGDVSYTGGKLVLEGNTKVKDGNKITMSAGREIGVKNLSAYSVAKIAADGGFDSWKKDTAVIVSETGDTKPMSETLRKFTLDSKRWVLVQGSGDAKDKGVLGSSQARVEIEEYIVEFTPDTVTFSKGTEKSITVNPSVKLKSDMSEVSAPLNEFSDWKISIWQGEKELQNADKNQITLPAGYPSGTYSLKISVKYKNLDYSGSFEIRITE